MTDENAAQPNAPSRRYFLAGAGASAAAALTPATRVAAATPNYQAKLFPIVQSPVPGNLFPEQGIARYSATAGQWGVAFSGGGTRAFSAALGQMRGLRAAGVIDDIGAISCVSGGTWFGAPFTFAPTSFSDATLLGPLVPPGALSKKQVHEVLEHSLAALVQNLSDKRLKPRIDRLFKKADEHLFPRNQIYARMLNEALLVPLQLGDLTTPFTLNQASQRAIQARNPRLSEFYMPRAGRPFFIAGGTQIYDKGLLRQTQVREIDSSHQIYNTIEYTPLYVGATVRQAGSLPYGGGFVESFAFNTPTPQPLSGNLVSVPPGQFPFVLSDVIGSSSAAPEFKTERYFHSASIFPEFSYWPVSGANMKAATYAFGDGGTLDNTGVISLLRRGYKTIFAFVNSGFPLGTKKGPGVLGVDGEISRLFGLIPHDNQGKRQSNQVFDPLDFPAVALGLKDAYAKGGPAVYAGSFRVIDHNTFGIESYTPKIFWIYNAWNNQWRDKLQPEVQGLFANKANNLGNFPNYETVGQNGLDEPLYLTPMQVNLLAQMSAYTVQQGFANFGYAFGKPIH